MHGVAQNPPPEHLPKRHTDMDLGAFSLPAAVWLLVEFHIHGMSDGMQGAPVRQPSTAQHGPARALRSSPESRRMRELKVITVVFISFSKGRNRLGGFFPLHCAVAPEEGEAKKGQRGGPSARQDENVWPACFRFPLLRLRSCRKRVPVYIAGAASTRRGSALRRPAGLEKFEIRLSLEYAGSGPICMRYAHSLEELRCPPNLFLSQPANGSRSADTRNNVQAEAEDKAMQASWAVLNVSP